ncbi:sulfotransferase [Pseudomonas sp. NBRC 100443]|uniref:sulfotransferase family protein n=1 Tax=Pseudomonas sp. NBRC 100443 TaxID=1113665 RepID=UPI0024A34F76|nr:sulfotransferase [Pseudomonas sp. NBRC 100443]GLU37318.1 putative sulfotransferase [Pseudomonas sp. NBRC 100443]
MNQPSPATTARGAALDVPQLMRAAQQESGLSDWGDDASFQIGLERLVDSLNQIQAPAEFFQQAQARLQHSLVTRLRLTEDARLNPEIVQASIERPIIVIGLPRTGTTVLYDLLALDPDTRTPRDWEFAMPWPATEAATFDSDPRITILNQQFAQILQLAPALADIQHFEATNPSECNLALTHHFATTQFFAEWSVPNYSEWLREVRPPGQYRTHKRLLQQLQWKGPRGRWTLKSPGHLFDLDGLIEAYPDAGLIWTHRDPLFALSSLTSMICQFRQIIGIDFEPKRVGRQVLDMWSTAIERACTSRLSDPAIERAVIDIPHRDVIADRNAVVRRIHEHFDLPWNAEHQRRLEGDAAGNATQRLGKHKHRPEEFGLSAEEVRERLPLYYRLCGDFF